MNQESNSNLKQPWAIDVAVLCIFFVRDECFAKVFAAVKQARPRVLLLWQDGPRENRPNDQIGIQKCREIAEDIDWDCEVHRFYNEKNYGCDPSTFYSHKWAFSIVDKCIILEDDLVPDQTFFRYCKELLDKYENDTRINKICGFCNLKEFDRSYDYIFSTVGSGPGFATWKRVADLWDEKYTFLDDTYTMDLYFKLKNSKAAREYYQTCLRHKHEGVAHWETIQTYARHLNSQLNIIPTRNLIRNVGLGENSTHSNLSLKMIPSKLRGVFFPEAHELEFPLKHPKYVFENITYKEKLFKITGKGHPLTRFRLRLESLWRRIWHGDWRNLVKGMKRRIAGK